jgi:hypothetical protein
MKLLFLFLFLIFAQEKEVDEATFLVRSSELIVKAKLTSICNYARIIPARAWYPDELKEEQRIVLGYARLDVEEVLKGKINEESPVIFGYGSFIFFADKDLRKETKMTDFIDFNKFIGKTKIWFLSWDNIANMYVIRKYTQIQSIDNIDRIKELISKEKGEENVIIRPLPKPRPDVLEGTIKEIDLEEKDTITVEVPLIKIKGYEDFAGSWKFFLPNWMFKLDSPLPPESLRKGDNVRIVSLPSESENERERDAYVIEPLKNEKPMEAIKSVFEVKEKKEEKHKGKE